nr:hypothetical protein [uncultured Desulfosarcina sp.]
MEQFIPFGLLQINPNHFLNESFKSNFWFPSKFFFSLCRIAKQRFDFSGGGPQKLDNVLSYESDQK